MSALASAQGGLRGRLKDFFFPNIEKRWKPHVFMNIASAIFIAWSLFFMYLQGNWHLGIDPQVVKCLPYDYFLISQNKPDGLVRGKIYQYEAHGLAPVVKDRTRLVKIAAALPGDIVDVSRDGIFINGKKWGDLNAHVMEKTNHSVAGVTKHYTITAGQVLLLGTLPRSYDGRYYGPVQMDQVAGRAFPLW